MVPKMATREQKSTKRRLDLSLRKIREKYGESWDPLIDLADFAADNVIRLDPINGVPVRIPIETPLRLQALNSLVDRLHPKLKSVDMNVGLTEETIARQQVLSQVPLETLVATLQADSRVGIEQGGDVIEHDPLDALDNIPVKPKTS